MRRKASDVANHLLARLNRLATRWRKKPEQGSRPADYQPRSTVRTTHTPSKVSNTDDSTQSASVAPTATKSTDRVSRTSAPAGDKAPNRWIKTSTVGDRQTEPERRIRSLRLGVDYGTSNSKLVITDYGSVDGERSFVVRPQTQPDRLDDYRIPSTISFEDDTMHFGFAAESQAGSAATIYRSLKMWCAYPERFYGDPADLPPKLNARDLATLYVGHLTQLGQEAGNRYAARFQANPSLSVTLGVPMAQIDDAELQAFFVNMAREAFVLRERINLLGGVSTEEALQALVTVRDELSGSVPEQPRDWVRSEAEAALFWAHSSPDIQHGRYACVDVGAGTTSASWFHIKRELIEDVLTKGRLSFYAADCSPPGCDAIDAVLAEHFDLPTRAAARGCEAELLEQIPSTTPHILGETLDKIARVFGRASGEAFEKEKSMRAWKKIGRIFLLGGGNKIEMVRERLIAQKKPWLKADPIAQPSMPANLTEEDGSELQEDPAFLLVAYGLAHRLADVPDISRPSEVPAFKPGPSLRKRPSHEELYSK